MANKFPCNCYYRGNVLLQTTLSFNTEGEYCLEVHGELGLSLKLMLADLNGYNVEGQTIILVRKPELQIPNVVLEFPTEGILHVVLLKMASFFGEEVNVPTPPSNDGD